MRIKTRLIITALAMMLSMASFGQSPIKVKEFRMLPNGIMDPGVLTKDQQTDYDGNKVCLIKVRAFGIGEETMQRLSFKTNGPFITHKEYENGEYRLYVSSNREGSIVIRYNGDCEYILPSRLKEGKIYEMVLEMETGTLTVVATPVEAKIYVDDAYAGTGSVNVQVSVGAEHRYRVESQDYIKEENSIFFAKSEKKIISVELVPNFGYITVKSEPSGAEVYIDDKKAGTTPYLARRISRGQHRVEVRKRGYEPYAEVVTININETTRIEDVKLEASDDVEVEDIELNAEVDQNEIIEEYVYEAPEIEEEEIVEAEIFKVVEEMPEFPGGAGKLLEYIGKNIKYPMMARESDIQGKVFVQFVVEPDGNISHVQVLRGIGGGCDEEAVRVVESMPKWKPGKQRGAPVRVQYMVPIVFKP